MRVTIRDVAREAGVSISTVSRVLNDTCFVEEGKRRRVKDAAERLSYSAHPAARSLLKQETGGVGVIVPSVSGEYFSEFLTGIDHFTQESGFYLLISSSHRSTAEFETALNTMYRRVDGLIIMAPDQGGFDASHRVLRSMPVVYVNSPFDSSLSDSIGFNNFEGFYNITSHLVDMGHRRIAMITGPATAIDAQERLRGYRQALRDGGIEPESSLEVVGNFTRQSGYQAVSTILGSRKRPTAIAAANDLSAMGAISALHEAGVRIPDQMAITGFDDDPSARYSTPPLSTVRVRPREMGRLAIQYLVGRIRKVADAEGRKIELPFEIVLRASSLGSRREGASRTS